MPLRCALLIGALLSSGCRPHAPTVAPPAVAPILAAEIILPADLPGARPGVRFGGISAVAALPGGRELLALSDDRANSRMYRLRLTGEPPSMRIDPVATILLGGGPDAPRALDPEGLVRLGNGHVLISSEGIGDTEPRVPPGILEYTAHGRFVRQLTIPLRFVQNARGPLTRGVRVNAGFEALTISPDGRRVFTANEVPLAQDGPENAFAPGGRVRLVEYVGRGGPFEPARELAYEIAPLDPAPFEVGYAVNGLVELLFAGENELLALERGFVQSADRTQGINRIRIFRLTLDGATDVSAIETLASPAVTPVRKTLVTDLGSLSGLSPSLRNLDNFEALAWVRGPHGRRSLLVASDDNFNAAQVTAFLLLALE